MATLAQIEEDLRRAVESRRFSDVERLITAYCKVAHSYVTSREPDDPEARAVEQMVFTLLEWTGQMLRASRESIALDLSRLPRVKRYLPTPREHTNSLHVEG